MFYRVIKRDTPKDLITANACLTMNGPAFPLYRMTKEPLQYAVPIHSDGDSMFAVGALSQDEVDSLRGVKEGGLAYCRPLDIDPLRSGSYLGIMFLELGAYKSLASYIKVQPPIAAKYAIGTVVKVGEAFGFVHSYVKDGKFQVALDSGRICSVKDTREGTYNVAFPIKKDVKMRVFAVVQGLQPCELEPADPDTWLALMVQ